MKILIADIETAPNKVYAWGLWNQNIAINQIVEPGYTLCWAAKWYGKRKIEFDSLYYSTKTEMIQRMWDLLDEADAVVHYNGTKFDIPVLNAEFIQEGLAPPSPFHEIDLYKTVKRRLKLPSNKLDYVASHLHLAGKHHHKGMSLWQGCMDGDARSWKEMEKYNKQDVRMLEPIYEHLLPWIQNHPNHALFIDSNNRVCTNCGSTHVNKVGVETTQTQMYQRYRCQDCGTPMRGRFNVTPKDKKPLVLTQSKL